MRIRKQVNEETEEAKEDNGNEQENIESRKVIVVTEEQAILDNLAVIIDKLNKIESNIESLLKQ